MDESRAPSFFAGPWDDVEVALPRPLNLDCRVQRWVHANVRADWEDPRPLWTERSGYRSVRKALAGPPKRLETCVQYGYDTDGRIVVARRFETAGDGPVVGRESTWQVLHGEAVHVEFVRGFGGTYRLGRVLRPVRVNDRVVAVEGLWGSNYGGGWSRERYEYCDDRLIAVVTEVDNEPTSRAEVAYDDSGEVTMITSIDGDGGPPTVDYRRASSREVQTALRVMHARLPQAVTAWVRRRAPREAVYCLALVYDFDDPYRLPPALALGTERERQSAAGLFADAFRGRVWRATEFALFDPEPTELVMDDELGSAWPIAAQEWRTTIADDAPRALLARAAKTLAGQDWTSIANVASAFAGYATDDEGGDIDRNLRASVPRAVRNEAERVRR
jgi:hypothetical protein